MRIVEKLEVIKVSISNTNEYFKKYNMHNRSYARVNGRWRINTGGGELNWAYAIPSESVLLEEEFKNITKSTSREDKINNILNEN